MEPSTATLGKLILLHSPSSLNIVYEYDEYNKNDTPDDTSDDTGDNTADDIADDIAFSLTRSHYLTISPK